MSYSAHPTVVHGQIWTATDQNTYVAGNQQAMWVYTTKGDIAVALDADDISRLAVGGNGKVITADSGQSTGLLYKVPFFELKVEESFPPLSGINGAALELSESSGAGTAKPAFFQVRYDPATDEGREWNFRFPADLTTLYASFFMASANTDKDVVFVAQLAGIGDGDASVTAKVFASANSVTKRVPNSANEEDVFSITLTNDDSGVLNDRGCLILYRDADHASDNAASGDLVLTQVWLE